MQRAEHGMSSAGEQRPDLQPTLRYIIRYVVREIPPYMQQVQHHQHQQQAAEPTWALIKETTEILPVGCRRMWMRELHPQQLQQAPHLEPVFHVRAALIPRRSISSRIGGERQDTTAALYRGAAGLEKATQKARDSTEKAAAAATQAAEAVAAAYAATRAATATAGVAAGAAAASRAQVTNTPLYNMEWIVHDDFPRLPRRHAMRPTTGLHQPVV